jgi:fibronectin-binding autotransporter adhesin
MLVLVCAPMRHPLLLVPVLAMACGEVNSSSPDAAPDAPPTAPIDAAGTEAPDAAGDASVDADPGPQPLTITGVDPAFLAHGARAVIRGTGLGGITTLSIGGQALVPVTATATEIVVDVPDNVGTGTVPLLLQRGAEQATTTVAVGRLLINEVDPEPDSREFVELVVGNPGGGTTAGLVVSGYTLVAFDAATQRSIAAIDIAATASSGELILLRGPGTVAPPTLPAASIVDYPAAFLPNAIVAVTVYQGRAVDFPLGTMVTATGLIDALVYEANDDRVFPTPCPLLAVVYGGRDTCVLDEDSGDDQNIQAVARCFAETRRGSSTWRILRESPGVANACPTGTPSPCLSTACSAAGG